MEIERMDLMIKLNGFLPEHRQHADHLITHSILLNVLISTEMEQGNYESTYKYSVKLQDNLKKLDMLKDLKRVHSENEEQEDFYAWLDQQKVNYTFVKKLF